MHLDTLIVAQTDDYHAQAVKYESARLGYRCEILDSADFPRQCSLELRVDSYDEKPRVHLEHSVLGPLDIGPTTGVWWRRPRPHNLRPVYAHPKLEQFANDESRQAFLGSLAACCPNFINPFGASRQATYKVHQLTVAKKLGFDVGRTLVTNKADSVRDFIRTSKQGAVYKTFTGTDFGFFETRPVQSEADLAELWRVEHCPVIFQEWIRGEFDIRVTVVDEAIFVAEMDLAECNHPVDNRADRLPTRPHELPSELADRIRELVRQLQLRYAAIDLRFSHSRGYVFLELNPEGQYLWLEIDAGLPISKSLASALASARPT